MTRECRDLIYIKKIYEILIDSNYTTTVDKFSYFFGRHYNSSVITDNQTTANMDTIWLVILTVHVTITGRYTSSSKITVTANPVNSEVGVLPFVLCMIVIFSNKQCKSGVPLKSDVPRRSTLSQD